VAADADVEVDDERELASARRRLGRALVVGVAAPLEEREQ
jgi:hypothetical protein